MIGEQFDLFIKFREYIPEQYRRYIQQARLFNFDLLPTESLAFGLENMEEASFNFVLPFPVVAVEDKISCVIVWDTDKTAVGTDKKRGIIEIANMYNYTNEGAYRITPDETRFGITEESSSQYNKQFRKQFTKETSPISIRCGYISAEWEGTRWKGQSDLLLSIIVHQDGNIIDLMDYPEKSAAIQNDFFRGAITAIEELTRISSPHTFIVEEKSINNNKKKRKYVPAAERSIYTVLRPDAIRKLMKLPEPERTDKRTILERRAYIRREHTRTLRNEERFGDNVGKIINVKRAYVPAIWHGPESSVVNKKQYRVILDLPKQLRDSCE